MGYAYEESQRVKLPKSLDPAELLQMFSPARPATSLGFSLGGDDDAAGLADEELMMSTQGSRFGTGPASPHHQLQPIAPRAATSLGHYRHPDARAPTSGKMVYWDGLKHHVVDLPDHGGKEGFEPPRIRARQLAHSSESVVGRGETHLTESVRIVSSRLRTIPDPKGGGSGSPLSTTGPVRGGNLASTARSTSSTFVNPSMVHGPIPGPYGPNKTSYGLMPYAPAHLAVSFIGRNGIKEATLKAYGAYKVMGHKDYEGTMKAMKGAQAWKAADLHLASSTNFSQTQNHIISPQDHVASRLSLRRTAAY